MAVVFVPPEGGRYATSLLFVPGLWTPAGAWRGAASFLGHRGWEGRILDLVGTGGLGQRAEAVARQAQGLPAPPVILGHGAGAAVALEAARRGPAAAVVLVCPVVPGSPASRALARRWDALGALALGRGVPPPTGEAAARAYGPGGAHAPRLEPDAREAVLDVVRGRFGLDPAPGVPTLVVSASDDPLLAPQAAAALAGTLGAGHRPLAGGHWVLVGPGWQGAVAAIHRWLVQTLGEPLLELYEEAMAEREDTDEPEPS